MQSFGLYFGFCLKELGNRKIKIGVSTVYQKRNMATKFEKKSRHYRRKVAAKKNKFRNNLDFDKRYGNIKRYGQQCAIAHKSTHGLCCVCMTAKSEELHHAFYGRDIIGVSVFPTCLSCHQNVCHSSDNWVIDHKNPVWKNRNTTGFTQRLQLGYKLLYEGINF